MNPKFSFRLLKRLHSNTSAGAPAFYDKSGSIGRFAKIYGNGSTAFDIRLYTIVDDNGYFVRRYNMLTCFFQLIQSQSQTGASSTES